MNAAIKLLHADQEGFARIFGQSLHDEYAALFGLEPTEDTTAPTLQSVTIGVDGETWTLVFSESVTSDGTGFSGDASAAGAVTLTYVSGSGTSTLVFTGDVVVELGEAVTLDYDAGTGNVADAASNVLASITDAEVTNDSEQEGPPLVQFATNETDGRLKLLFDKAITGNTGVSVTASGGAVTLSNPTPGANTRVLYFDQSRVPGPDEDVVVDIASSDIAAGGTVILDVADVPVWSYFLLADGKALLNPASNPTVRSIAAGEWTADAATVWDTGVAPTAADRVLVTHAVTVEDEAAVAGGVLVWTGGTLAFDPAVNTEIVVDTVVNAGTGVWQQGTSGARIAADKTSIVTFRDTALPHQQLDPFQMHGGWIACEDAVVDIYGAVITTDAEDMVLAVEPLTGHTTLTLAAAPTGWLDGYRVVIPDTRPINFGEGEQLEVRTIAGIVGAVITLDAPLTYDHPAGRDASGTIDVWPHISVIENNVIWRSANANGVRAHSMVTGACTVNASFPYLKNMGRTTNQSPITDDVIGFGTITDNSVVTNGITTHVGLNQEGRYPWHEHHHFGPENIPNTGFQSHLTGMSIEDGLKWSLTFHRTHFVEARGIRIYGANHAGVAFESGGECYNVLDNCSIIGVTNDGSFTIGDGLWGLSAGYNTITNNYIATVAQGNVGNVHTYQGHCVHLLDFLKRGGLNHNYPAQNDIFPILRGVDIDAVGAVEDTDYTAIADIVNFTFTAFSGNKGMGSTKFFSRDHMTGPDNTTIETTDNVSSGMGKEHYFNYGGSGHALDTRPVVRNWGESGYGLNTMLPDSTHTVVDPDIQQDAENAPNTQTSGFFWIGGAGDPSFVTVNGGTIAAHYPLAVYFATLGQDPGPPTATAPIRTQVFNGVTLSPQFGSTTEIDMRWGDQGTPRDNCGWEQVFVFDQDGSDAAYQLFWTEQGAAESCPVSATGYGATVGGRTNAQEFADSGRANGGEIMPAGASTEAWLAGGKAMALLSGVVDADGVTVTLTASAAITTDGTGFSVTGSTTGLVALAYVSGSGTKTLVFTAASTLVTGETTPGAYAAATGNASTTAAGVVLPDVAFGVTNDSEQMGGFEPDNLDNLVLWLQAGPTWCFQDAGATTPCGDGDLVALWVDQSGNGFDFSQATSGNRPTLQDLGSGIWVVRFDASRTDRMTGGDLSGSFSGAGTLAARFDMGAILSAGTTIVATKSNDMWDNHDGTTLSYPGQLRTTRIDAQPVVSVGKHTYVIRSSGAGWSRRLDGTQDSTGSANFNGGDNWQISGDQVGTDRYLDGDVAGIVAYSDILTDGECGQIETYLGDLLP